jgi:hypothetical protein
MWIRPSGAAGFYWNRIYKRIWNHSSNLEERFYNGFAQAIFHEVISDPQLMR